MSAVASVRLLPRVAAAPAAPIAPPSPFDRLMKRIGFVLGSIFKDNPRGADFHPSNSSPTVTRCGRLTIVNWTDVKFMVRVLPDMRYQIILPEHSDDRLWWECENSQLTLTSNTEFLFFLKQFYDVKPKETPIYVTTNDHGDSLLQFYLIEYETSSLGIGFGRHKVFRYQDEIRMRNTWLYNGLFSMEEATLSRLISQCQLYSTNDDGNPAHLLTIYTGGCEVTSGFNRALFKIGKPQAQWDGRCYFYAPTATTYYAFPLGYSANQGARWDEKQNQPPPPDHYTRYFPVRKLDKKFETLKVTPDSATAGSVLYQRCPSAQILTLFHRMVLKQRKFEYPIPPADYTTPAQITVARARKRQAEIVRTLARPLLAPLIFVALGYGTPVSAALPPNALVVL